MVTGSNRKNVRHLKCKIWVCLLMETPAALQPVPSSWIMRPKNLKRKLKLLFNRILSHKLETARRLLLCRSFCTFRQSRNRRGLSLHLLSRILRGASYCLICISILVTMGILAGCSGYHPSPETPPVKIPERFSLDGNLTSPATWWEAFGDKLLNRIEKQALTDNMDLKSAWARIMQARAEAKQAGAELYPWLDITAGAAHKTTRDEGSYFNQDILSLGAMASYELDLWGRIRKGREAAVMDVMAAEADLDTARITVSSEIALTYFEMQAVKMQIDIISRQIRDNRASLDIISSMYEYGQTDILDTLQQKQAVEGAIAQKIEKKMTLGTLKNRLAVLLGKAPEDLDIKADKGLPEIPPLPDSGLPLELINRRPDCRSAFFKLKAANARLAQAVAQQYPRFSLSASIETDASRVNDLFENWIATLAANMLTPVFEGRSLEAEVEKRQAQSRQALFDYGSTVLAALKEVEDAMVQESHQRRILKNMEYRLELSRNSLKQVKEQYEAGTVEFLRFLATELNTDALETKVITERLNLIKYRIALYRALAGPIPLGEESQAAPGSSRNTGT